MSHNHSSILDIAISTLLCNTFHCMYENTFSSATLIEMTPSAPHGPISNKVVLSNKGNPGIPLSHKNLLYSYKFLIKFSSV